MGLVKTLVVLGFLGGLSAVLFHFLCPCHEAEPPVLKDGWWGGILKKGEKIPADDPAIHKFHVNVKDADLQELQRRINAARLAEPLQDVQFQYGFNTNYLQEILTYWSKEYIPAWRSKHEKWLNSMDQYVTQIEGLKVHFLHVKPKVDQKTKVVPLMMIHGWPGSVVEFYKIIPLLTAPSPDRDFVFEVICPSIPGYAFSEAPKVAGFSIFDAARVFAKLMARLGHERYYVQGGDWGSPISTTMAMAYPDRIEGIHVNMAIMKRSLKVFLKLVVGSYFPSLVGFTEKDQGKLYPFSKTLLFILQETGYLHLQATKPDTVGVALGDSPAGLAAYILEKFSTWTDPAGRQDSKGLLTKKFTLDHLLTNVMVYWTTSSITSSVRFYKESFDNVIFTSTLDRAPIKVPSAIAAFPNELEKLPRVILEEQWKDLVLYTDMERGGHFGAMEEPDLLARELFNFVSIVRSRPVKKS